MRPVLVDVSDLDGLARAVAGLAGRAEHAAAILRAGANGPPARDRAVAASLAQLVQRAALLIGRLRALADVVVLVARRYDSVEAQVAASFGGPMAIPRLVPAPWTPGAGTSPQRLLDLLSRSAPAALEALLVRAPALARWVVDTEATSSAVPGLSAAELSALTGLVRASRRPGLAGRAAWLTAQRQAHDALVALGPRRLQLLSLLRPGLVTSAPSAPLPARWAASRVLVAADLDVLLRRQGALAPGPALDVVVRQLRQRRAWLDDQVVLRGPGGRERRQPHRLLSFDPRGDGQVVEVLGDLSRARHLAVLVPGTGSDLFRYSGTVARAGALAAADPSLAVVVWQGSDFSDQPFDDGVLPIREHVVAAAYRDAADVAGPALAADVEGLRVAAPPAARDLTVFGHSYGAAIVGAAQGHGMVADRVVHVAGAGTYWPAVGGTATNAEGPLAAQVTRQFAMTAYDDPIRLAQGHDLSDAATRWRAMTPAAVGGAAPVVAQALRLVAGGPHQVGLGPDPDLQPGVVRLDTGVFDDGRPVSGHSQMWTPGSTAWRNLLAVADGRPVQVLEPARWASHLEPAHLVVGSPGHPRWPHYVVDRSPWVDPAYRPPLAPTR